MKLGDEFLMDDTHHSPDLLPDLRSNGAERMKELIALRRPLKPCGIFGLWSNEPEDERSLDQSSQAQAEPIAIDTPMTERALTRVVYPTRKLSGPET